MAIKRRMRRIGQQDYGVQKKPGPRPMYTFNEKASSYMKYLRVVRKYIQKKYNLKLSELELLLFLYDESIFTEKTFNEYACTLGFTTFNWLEKFVERDVIKVWREQDGCDALYVVTQKYKIAINKFYNHLQGEAIPTRVDQNPLFLQKASFSDKMYAKLIGKMNARRKDSQLKDLQNENADDSN